MAKMKMRLGENPNQKEESFIKAKMKDELVDIAIDKTAGMAHLTIPVEMLKIMVDILKKIEKGLNQEQEQWRTR